MSNAREKYMLALANLVNGSELGYEDRSSIPQYKKDIEDYVESLEKVNQELHNKIDKTIEYIEKDTRWFDSEYASIYGELCPCEGARGNRLEVLVNPSNLLEMLKDGNVDE